MGWANLRALFDDIEASSTVVLVDDVAANLRLLESSLKAFGLPNIVSFSDAGAALAWARSNDWHLMLLDLDMPYLNGFDLLRELNARDRAASPIVIVTALNDVESRRRALELGCSDYLSKPIDLPEVVMRVRNGLRLSQTHRRLHRLNVELEAKVEARTAELRESYEAVIRALERAASYRDNETGGHITRIGDSAALVAQGLKQPPEWCELLRMAAPMHDVGKIGIPDHILLKPGALTPDERVQMNTHALIGRQILEDEQGNALTCLAAEIAYGHHEKWDGSGYPLGLKGEEIPLSARIVALCDVYDALRMARPYKQPWSAERAQAFILEQSGSHFDPAVVAVAASLFECFEDRLVRDNSGGP